MAHVLRIATFNLENLDDKPGLLPGIEERSVILRPQLLRLNADVLCLQEVNAQQAARHGPRELRALDKLLGDTPYAEFHRVVSEARAHKGPSDVHNLVVLSHFPVIEHRQYWHDLVPPLQWRSLTSQPPAQAREDVTWDRPVLHAVLDIGNTRPLHVFNLHLRAALAAFIPGQKASRESWNSVRGWAEGFFLTGLKRAGQSLEARIAVDQLFDADSSALIAVCGDFNAGGRETPVRAIRADVEDTGNAALANRALTALERSLPEAKRFSVKHGGVPVLLDHLLVSKTLASWCSRAEIHNEGLHDELIEAGRALPESFHAPVAAEFAIP